MISPRSESICDMRAFCLPPAPLLPSKEFTSAGGANTWETFTLSEVSNERNWLTITAVSGPSFVNVPDYPTLRVVDFQIVGEPVAKPVGEFQVSRRY